ncbi:MAG: ComF family protein [candidate division Zixibacteria bacterium]|nr:ComF family protein [candidate division Zixibacteria bacterium]
MSIQAVNKNSWTGAFLDFLFPPLCLGCGEYNSGKIDICDDCLEAIDRYENPFCLNCRAEITSENAACTICGEGAFLMFAWGNYIDPLKQVIIQYKFKEITSPSRIIAGAVCEQFGLLIKSLEADMLIPIPLHPSREYYRGYNQATLFAERLGEFLDIEVDDTILYRTEKRRPQARLNEYRRMRNIRGVFSVETGLDNTNGRKVLLVDDVVTSGATVYEARRTLQKAGFSVTGVIAMAHGL